MTSPGHQGLLSTRQDVPGTALGLAALVVAVIRRLEGCISNQCDLTNLLASTRVQCHNNLVHERDIEITREVK